VCASGDQLAAILSTAAARTPNVALPQEAPGGSSASTGLADADTATSSTSTETVPSVGAAVDPPAADSSSVSGEQDENAEVDEGSARGEPGEQTEPIVHGTDPALEPANDNEPAATEVPMAANDNGIPGPLPATGTE
jgi:hypothetical protein